MVGIPERNLEREPCELAASIESGVARPRLAVVVRNISLHGARLEGADAAIAPDQFLLKITHASGAVETLRARCVWRKDDAMGVKFIENENTARDRMIANDPAAPLRSVDIGLRYISARDASENSASAATTFSRICRSPL